MKLSSTKLRIITVLIFLMKQGILANQIDGTNNLEMSFLNDELEVEPKIELIEKKFESEENQGTNRFQYRRGIPIDEDIFQTDKDPTFIQEAILKLSKEVLSKLEGELKKKIQSELEGNK